MNETKKPQAGEWWRSGNGSICCCIGTALNGDPVFEAGDGFVVRMMVRSVWTHLSGCDGFDWVEPETRCPDCGEPAGDGHEDVCPEAWVVQNQVPDRVGIDEWRFTMDDAASECEKSVCAGTSEMHGSFKSACRYEVRCRRKDLPKPAATEQPKRREMTDEEKDRTNVPIYFVEITDPDHSLRAGIDWIGFRDGWEAVLKGGMEGEKIKRHPTLRFCCHVSDVSDAPQAAATASNGELDQFLPSTQQAFDDLHRRCSDLLGEVDRLKREVQTVVDGVGAAQDRYDRSLPVSREWLLSIGFIYHGTESISIKYSDRDLLFWPKNGKWQVLSPDGHCVIAESIPNRGRVIDLLNGLGVEVKSC